MRATALVLALLVAFLAAPPALDAWPTARGTGCYAAGIHQFTLTTAALTLKVGDDVDSFNLQGPTTVLVVPIGDSDGDGREELRTEILNFELLGQSAVFGPVKLSESPTRLSTGLIEEMSPGTCFPATSYFDVYVQAELPAPAHNDEAARMTVTLDAIPPTVGTSYGGPPDWIPLFIGPSHPPEASPDGAPIGFITHASHRPDGDLLPPRPPGCVDGLDNDFDGYVDYPADTGCRNEHDQYETGGSGHLNPCPDQPVHGYGLGLAGRYWRDVTALTPSGPVSVTVWDGTVSDCNPSDGVPGDFDGDYDFGMNGAFFGYGQWVQADCDYDLNAHGPNVVQNDFVFGSTLGYHTGEVDQAGPVQVDDPITGVSFCETDGLISPGDPATDPTADPDDCLSDLFIGSGTTCGFGGGDGGFWVILVVPVSPGPGIGNPPTGGTITAF